MIPFPLKRLLLPLLLLLSTPSSSTAKSPTDNEIYCTQGFGAAATTKKIRIEAHQINDGYCDCPFEHGIDEPDTDACSGSIHWAGIPSTHEQEEPIVATSSCPQQQNVHLSHSKINDSICDCCDGYDEPQMKDSDTACPDVCDVVLREERQRQEEIEQKYRTGSKLRSKSIETYNDTRMKNQQALHELEQNEIPSLEGEIVQYKKEVKELKIGFWNTYYDAIAKLYQSDLRGIPNVENTNDVAALKDVVSSICQLYGEMVSSSSPSSDVENTLKHNHEYMKSCLPLRLAGLDVGLIWNVQNGGDYVSLKHFIKEHEEEGDDLALEIATLLLNNHNHDGDKKKKLDELKVTLQREDFSTKRNATSKKRQVDMHNDGFIPDKEDSEDIYMDDDHDFMDDDDHEHDHHRDHHRDHNDDDFVKEYNALKKDADYEDQTDSINQRVSEVDDVLKRARMAAAVPDVGVDKEIDDNLASVTADEKEEDETIFHSSYGTLLRGPFDKQSKVIIGKIDSLLNDNNEGDDEDDEQDLGENVDPMAFTVVRNVLDQKRTLMENGNEMALSAKTFLQVLEKQMTGDATAFLYYLKQIVVGTIYHSNLHALDILEVLALMNIDVETMVDRQDSCFDFYYILCSQDVSNHLTDRCKERNNENKSDSCGDEITSKIPSHIPDGYHNFYSPSSREVGDYFTQLFQNMEMMKEAFSNSSKVSNIEKTLHDAEGKLEEMRKKATSLRDTIGNEDEYGPGGVLYSLRQRCFSITANKYTYELCMFDKAEQRESGVKKGSGTSLGSWVGSSIEETSGMMVFKWTNGLKCWNGPNRSATAFVTCGTHTTVISADEPNICEYEFKMESMVACDDNFKKFHNIAD